MKSWCTVACQHALPPVAHCVSAELQEMLVLHRDSTVVAERLFSKAIWRLRRKERRKRAAELVASSVETKRAPGPRLTGSPNHFNWSSVYGVQSGVADKMIADFLADDTARAAHVKNWSDLDLGE